MVEHSDFLTERHLIVVQQIYKRMLLEHVQALFNYYRMDAV